MSNIIELCETYALSVADSTTRSTNNTWSLYTTIKGYLSNLNKYCGSLMEQSIRCGMHIAKTMLQFDGV